jgi:hypothetical protein
MGTVCTYLDVLNELGFDRKLCMQLLWSSGLYCHVQEVLDFSEV